ncbi:PPC domain-containing DNA-binding protein [Mucilaginibacter agri]|uniref:DUF296 domain-containing protein n=1 Tax=Mucilaginibacter agri TaxID=2695265 RepID=A0A966DVM3_9SPHI|nr:PPC domain-containing DNA-binding protein [Mucilaginibacter agri]NCD70674.1 DUF296 domain-containing protein [Mucilaginibacter agri]
MTTFNKLVLTAFFGLLSTSLFAQEYLPATNPAKTGRSPGVKVKLLNDNGGTKVYVLVFAKGDEVMSGLTEFAQKYKVTSASFTAIGDATSSKFGWFDKDKKMFKVFSLNEQAEITSMVGDISIINGKPSVHAHVNVADQNGMVHGGHLIEAFVYPTLEVVVTVTPAILHKQYDAESNINLLHPEL